MSIEALKEKARTHEQREEWRKALDDYRVAIAKLEDADEPDVALYNRVGDLFVRIGNYDEAFSHYERAVDLYVDAGLQNNAIAVCKKMIRGLPGRPQVFLRMGQIRAAQGFLSDARTNFLVYAERMQEAGDLDESFRALLELCELAPEDVDLLIAVGEQLASHGRVEEAVEQLRQAYYRLVWNADDGRAQEVCEQILALAPDADLTVPDPAELEVAEPEGVDFANSYGAVDLDAEPLPAGADEDEGYGETLLGVGEDGSEVSAHGPAEVLLGDEPLEEEVVVQGSLPKEAFLSGGHEEDEEGGEGEDSELPLMDFASAAEELEAAAEELEAATAIEEVLEETASARAVSELPLAEVSRRIEGDPDDVALRQRFLELAYQSGDQELLVEAFVGLGRALERAGEIVRAKVSYQQALELDPSNPVALAALGEAPPPETKPVQEVASHEDYVDLGSLVLGDQDEKTTRFVVAYEAPTGDEDADFAKMLSQFKEKVSENLDADDVKAHYDLGTAYREMGLLDEAVAEFQQALRASASHLPTYELLGQTFIEMGKPEAAIRSLQRALDMDFDVEDELLAIYYFLGRAHEEVGNTKEALDLYDRVFSLDINFADVTSRLRALR